MKTIKEKIAVIMSQRFAQDRVQRSESFKAGFEAHLSKMFGDPPQQGCVFFPGSAEFDAWWMGWNDAPLYADHEVFL